MKEKEAIDFLFKSGCSPDVVEHCRIVAELAKKIADDIKACAEKKGKSVDVDTELVFLGGMLHDIGRSKTHGIGHAVAGARIAIENGLDKRLVNIIERHIGAGIPREEAAPLGLPEKDYMPLTLEEKIVAHADNLVFGNRVGTIEEVVANLRKKQLDEKVISRFIELNDTIGEMLC